jgi:creatinine amidohydrolase
MRFGDYTYQEIAALAREGAVAVVPLDCTEQQGPHLPVDFDTWFAETVVTAAAGQAEAEHGLPVLALPALPAGPAPEHRSFGAGYLDLPVAVHEAVVRAILDSLRAQGFQVTVVWRGCGGHDLRRLVARYNDEDHQMRVHLPEPPFPSLWSAAGGSAVPAGHADSFTTSIMLARRPELVRADRIPGPSRQPDWSDPGLDFGAYSDTGVIGDARHAARSASGSGRKASTGSPGSSPGPPPSVVDAHQPARPAQPAAQASARERRSGRLPSLPGRRVPPASQPIFLSRLSLAGARAEFPGNHERGQLGLL